MPRQTSPVTAVPVLSGLKFALSGLSGDALSQKELGNLITQHGGSISNLVHRRVDFLIATGLAVLRNTQAVRKARKNEVMLVRPSFIFDSIEAGSLLDPADYEPDPSDIDANERPREGSTMAAVGLQPGESFEVQVEMSDPPPLVWWPVRCTPRSKVDGSVPLHDLIYLPLLSRGYDEETPSRCTFDAAPGAQRLWDADEAVWRSWRRMGAPALTAAPAAVDDHNPVDEPAVPSTNQEPEPMPLRAADFGCPLPKATCLASGISGQRQRVLLDTLRSLEAASSSRQYHRLAQQNLQRWRQSATPQPTAALNTVCRVLVLPGDWGQVTLELTKRFGATFAALNMANAFGPGGGYTDGMVAQEENMFRRTDCHFSLEPRDMNARRSTYVKRMTRLLNAADGRVYLDTASPRVCVRGNEERGRADLGYEWLQEDDVFPFYELRAAAVDLRDGSRFSERETARRIGAQLDTLVDAGVRHAVLSAFGCGAFMNPAASVAAIYRQELQKRASSFDVVAFAIFAAGYGPDNFTPFAAEFEGWPGQEGGAPRRALQRGPKRSPRALGVKSCRIARGRQTTRAGHGFLPARLSLRAYSAFCGGWRRRARIGKR